MATTGTPQPVFVLAPYLPLSTVHSVGPWRLAPRGADELRWVDSRVRKHVDAFLRHFVDVHGRSIEHPTIIYRSGEPIGASEPTMHEFSALQLAVTFAVLDASVDYSEETARATWRVATSDNADIQGWRVSRDGSYSVALGAIVQSWIGGLNVYDDHARVPPPAELHLPSPLALDADLATAIYSYVLRNDDSRIFRNVIRWLDKAWRNTVSIDQWDRLVFLRTAFEALLGVSSRFAGARLLRTRFEERANSLGIEEAGGTLLWSPAEPTATAHWTVRGQERTEERTELQRWYLALCEARNEVVHDGNQPDLLYGEGTAYDGPLLHVAKRVLCEALKLDVSLATDTSVWMTQHDRQLQEIIGRLLDEREGRS